MKSASADCSWLITTSRWLVKLLAQRLERERDRNKLFAQIACQAVDLFTALRTPEVLQEVQEGLLLGLLEAEEQIQKANVREAHRRKNWGRLTWLDPASHERRGRHLRLAQLLASIFHERRNIIRQCGDALAWLLLHHNPRQFEALFSASRNHHLTRGLGLDGVRNVLRSAHETGKFLALNADLTRCLGFGDIVVIPTEGRWIRPLVYEVKTHRLGAEVEIELFAHRIHHPIDEQFDLSFYEALNFQEGVAKKLTSRAERQWNELGERARMLIDFTHGIVSNVPVRSGRWRKVVKVVIEKALHYGTAYDCPEPNLVYRAFRRDQAPPTKRGPSSTAELIVNEALMPSGSRPAWLSTDQFIHDDVYSKAIPPVALWDLPRPVRCAVLTGDVILICVWDFSVWKAEFERLGISFTDVDGAWQLSLGETKAHLDLIEVRTVLGAVAFAGASPRDVVSSLAKSL
ncbi:MAG TPA: hypothetical protein VF006_14780 [Longimicrobium sp.]